MENKVEKFANTFATKYSIDPIAIIGIIQAIMTIIQSCQENKDTIRERVKKPTLIQRVRARRIIMENVQGVTRIRAGRIADELIEHCSAQSDEELSSVIETCCKSEW